MAHVDGQLVLGERDDRVLERSEPAIPPCRVCGIPTLRRASDGMPMHSSCEPQAAGATDPTTSHMAAARAQLGTKSPLAREIVTLLRHAGDKGLTDAELCHYLQGSHPGSVSKRRGDLTKAGRVSDSGRTRLTPYGSQAIVWRLASSTDELGR